MFSIPKSKLGCSRYVLRKTIADETRGISEQVCGQEKIRGGRAPAATRTAMKRTNVVRRRVEAEW